MFSGAPSKRGIFFICLFLLRFILWIHIRSCLSAVLGAEKALSRVFYNERLLQLQFLAIWIWADVAAPSTKQSRGE